MRLSDAVRAGALAAVLLASPRMALAGENLVLPNLVVRNGSWLSAGLETRNEVGDDKYFVAAFDLGLGGFGAGLGFIYDKMYSRSSNGGCFGLEARLLQTYWLTSWPVSTYAGPELVMGSHPIRFTAGVMFDLAKPSEFHPQVGIGFGL